MTAPPSVRVVIDRLVLHGVGRADAAAVRRALSGELETMLEQAGPEALDEREAGAPIRLDIAPSANAAGLGRASGRALAAALTGSTGGGVR